MSEFLKLVRGILPSIETQAERDVAYLSESVDIQDLERRMRELDARAQGAANSLRFGLLP